MTDESLAVQSMSAVVGTIPILGPILGPIAGWLTKQSQIELQRHFSTAIRAASRESGMTREEIEEAVSANPALLPLYVRFLYAAGMNGSEETLAALGVGLGVAVKAVLNGDDVQAEQMALVLKALDGMSSRHFAVLDTINRENPQVENKDSPTIWNYPIATISELTGLDQDQLSPYLVTLSSGGLATQLALYNGTGYKITELGKAVLRAVRRSTS